MKPVITNMLIPEERLSMLISKIISDLEYGVKIIGNQLNKTDTIRVWTSSQENIFGIVATSSNRFETKMNILEIQSFRKKPYIKLTIFIGDSDSVGSSSKFQILNDNFMEVDTEIEKAQGENFVQEYLASKPDILLTKSSFEKYAYNKNQYLWLKPELYK